MTSNLQHSGGNRKKKNHSITNNRCNYNNKYYVWNKGKELPPWKVRQYSREEMRAEWKVL